ncbi:MAG: hypothetical protein E7607_02195 [Ruminococcaceae bacterium]|nr:hypothetical protein [Oscillospiraceae bacterium]
MKLFSKKSYKQKGPKNNNADSENSTFIKKLGRYFSTEPQKEKVLSMEDFDGAGDVYYATVSAYYKVSERILVVVLIAFLLFSIIVNRREITYDNFYFLLRDIPAAADEANNVYETISYEADSRQYFVSYRGGIASVSPSKISIFTATGRRTLNTISEFSSPYAVSSDKYVLFYDMSGNTFSIYNSFSRIYTETLDDTIKCACLADDGSFAVVTRTTAGTWKTRVYTKKFKLRYEIETPVSNNKVTSNHIFGIAMDSERQKLALISYDMGNGMGRTSLSVYDISGDESLNGQLLEHRLEYGGEFPLKCGFMGKDSFAMITDGRIRIYDKDFEVTEKSFDFIERNLTGFHLSKNGVAVSAISDTKCMILAYGSNGEKIYDSSVSYNVKDIGVYEDYIFLQTDHGITRINTKTSEKVSLDSGQGKMLVYNESTAILCGESKAEYIVFKD